MNTYSIVREFETELGKYTGAPYVVCVDSCTNAIFFSCYRLNVKSVTKCFPKNATWINTLTLFIKQKPLKCKYCN